MDGAMDGVDTGPSYAGPPVATFSWFDDVDCGDGSESDGGCLDDDGSPLPLPPTAD
jgi:hypothetical protein